MQVCIFFFFTSSHSGGHLYHICSSYNHLQDSRCSAAAIQSEDKRLPEVLEFQCFSDRCRSVEDGTGG